MNKAPHRHFTLHYTHGAPGHAVRWQVDGPTAARKMAATLRKRTHVAHVTYSEPCECRTPNSAPVEVGAA